MTHPETAAPAREPKTIPIPFPRAKRGTYTLAPPLIGDVHNRACRIRGTGYSLRDIEAVLLALEEIYGG